MALDPEPMDIETREGRFVALQVGAPDGPLVLCAHGFPDHAPSFLPLMERLGAAGYRVVAPWMRGYAPSVLAGPYDAEQLGSDIIAIADALGADERAVLVGHDWGAAAAYVALQRDPHRFRRAVTMAVPHPAAFFRALIRQPAQLRRSWYMLFFQLPILPEAVLRHYDLELVRRLWRTWSPGYVLPDEDWRVLRACLEASMPAPIEYYRAITRPLGTAVRGIREQLSGGTIQTSVLQLHGASDGCIAPSVGQGQERYFTGEHQARVLPGVGHFLHLEDPERVAEHVLSWIGRDGERGGR